MARGIRENRNYQMMLHCSIDTHRLTGMKNRCQRPRTGEDSHFSKHLLLVNIALKSFSRITIKTFILPTDVFLLHAFVTFLSPPQYLLPPFQYPYSYFNVYVPIVQKKEVIFSREHSSREHLFIQRNIFSRVCQWRCLSQI